MRTDQPSPLNGRRVLVAVSGSIAAVKTPLLVSALVKAGAEVRCLVTSSGAALVSPVALASLSRHRCYLEADQWNPVAPRPLHIELAEWAELTVVAPLSASSLARSSSGQLGPGMQCWCTCRQSGCDGLKSKSSTKMRCPAQRWAQSG